MGKRPAFQFYPRDWMADPDLQTCTLSAQGLWILMLCVMHYCDPYGHLVTKKGKPMPVDKLALLTPGYTADQVDSLLAELGDAGVYSQTDEGVIYSRRMVEDYQAYQRHRKGGVAGGKASAAKRWGTEYDEDGNRVLPDDDKQTGNEIVSHPSEPFSNTATATATASATAPASAAAPHVPVPFDDIWALVPVGRKVAKEEARLLWDGKKNTKLGKRMTTEDQHTVMARYPLHVAMWKRDGQPTGKIPHLRTWLSQSRWVDEIEGTAPDPGADWVCECYRKSCEEKHGSDPDWACYADWATDYSLEHGPRTSPTFDEFKTGGDNG